MNIAGIPKPELLAALWNAALSPASQSPPMTAEVARNLIGVERIRAARELGLVGKVFPGAVDRIALKVDWLIGRKLAVDLSGRRMETADFDMANGSTGLAERVVRQVRREVGLG